MVEYLDNLFIFIAHIFNTIKNLIIGETIGLIQLRKDVMTGFILGTWVNCPAICESFH